MDNIAVDITFQQGSSVASSLLVEAANQHFQKEHLFKRSVLLIKAWCTYESPRYGGQSVLGSNQHGLSTYAVNILVLAVFNGPLGSRITTPFHALAAFFRLYGDFDWQKYVVTVYGAMPIDSVFCTKSSQRYPKIRSHALPKRFLEKIRNKSRHCRTANSHAQFPVRCFNVLDPFDHTNNAARAVNRQMAPVIYDTLSQGRDHFSDVVSNLLNLYQMSLSYMVSDVLVQNTEAEVIGMIQHFFAKYVLVQMLT